MATFKYASSLLGAVGACLLAAQAQATPIDVTGFAFGSNQATLTKFSAPTAGPITVNAGAFAATVGSTSIIAWCADIYQTITLPGTYDFTFAAGSAVYTPAVNQKLGQLATGALGLVNNATTSAAFQLAVWEILYEGVTNLSLSSDDFIATSAAFGTAQSWLNELNEGFWTANNYTVGVWESGRTQDLLVFTKVPEPGSLAIIVLGLGFAGLARARRAAAAR